MSVTAPLGAAEAEDLTPPAVVINQATTQPDPAHGPLVRFLVQFNEPVDTNTLAAAPVVLSQDAAGTLNLASLTTSYTVIDASTLVVSVGGFAPNVQGQLTASIPAGVVQDAAGNYSTASTSTDNTVHFDNNALGATIGRAVGQMDPADSGPIHFTVQFSRTVKDFDARDLRVTGSAFETGLASGPATPSIAITTSDHLTYDVAVGGMAQDGTVSVAVAAAAAHDAYGNASAATSPASVEFAQPVTLAINQAPGQADPTASGPIDFLVSASEPLVDLVADAVVLSGTAGPTSATVSDGVYNAATHTFDYHVSVSGMTGGGTVLATIPAGAVHDANWLSNSAATSTDNTVTLDTAAPTVTVEQAATQADPSTVAPLHFAVTFSKAVTGFTAADVTLGGTAPGTLAAVVIGSGAVYDVAVSGMTGDGTVTASIPAGAVNDALGHVNAASTSADNSIDYHLPLTVTVQQAADQADPVNAGPINFTVTFSQPVVDFSEASVSLGGTAGPTTAVVTGSGTTYNVAVSGMTGDGSVVASIGAGVVHNAQGVANEASTGSDGSVLCDRTPPTATLVSPINGGYPQLAAINNQGYLDVAFTDGTGSGIDPSTITDDASEFTLSGQGALDVSVDGAPTLVSGSTYRYRFSGTFTGGAVVLNVAAGSLADKAGNLNAAGTQSFTVDSGPTVQIVDNGDTAYRTTGTWDSATAQGYSSDVAFAPAGSGEDVATWTFTVTPGRYLVAATWTSNANRASNAPYTVLDGSTTLATVSVDQTIDPADFRDSGSPWERLDYSGNAGVYTITGNTLVVSLSNNANHYVLADAIRVERIGDLPPGTPVNGGSTSGTSSTVVDDKDLAFSTSGTWVSYSGQGLDSQLHFAAAGTGDAAASWTFLVTPGRYRVAATWVEATNRATNAPFSIYLDGAKAADVAVDEQNTPADFTDQGVGWNWLESNGNLGIYTVTVNKLEVHLSNKANQYVIADAVRIERVADGPEIQIQDGATVLADGATLDFGSTTQGTPVTKTLTITNLGAQPLTLSGKDTDLPAGFQFAAGSGQTTVSPGQTASVIIQLTGAAQGTFSGTGSLVSNDGDSSRNPFHLALTGTVTAPPSTFIVDDQSGAFSTTGTWVGYSGQGYSGHLNYAPPGQGEDTATWTFPVTPGLYQIAATWAADANRATNAPFSIYDGTTLLATVTVNQQVAPAGVSDQGVAWKPLEDQGNSGIFTVTGNTLVVKLTNAADKYVIADAIRIQRVAPAAGLALAETVAVDKVFAAWDDGKS